MTYNSVMVAQRARWSEEPPALPLGPLIAEFTVKNRVSKEVEIAGLDLPEMGAPGYSGFVMDKAGETPVTS